MLRVPPAAGRPIRSRSDAKVVHRLQTELLESRSECKRLSEQVGNLQHKLQLVLTSKHEMTSMITDMQEFLNTAWDSGISFQ